MASDLDEKLALILGLYRRGIERNYGGRTVGKTLTGDEAVEQIEQAFKDAGWQTPGAGLRGNCMTGREWCDQFFEEFLEEFKSYKYITPEGSIVAYEFEKDLRKWVIRKQQV